jgi:hypothetical protein
MKKCDDTLRIKLQKHFDLRQDVTLACWDIDVTVKLVILVNEYSFYFGFRGDFYKQGFGLPIGLSVSSLLANFSMDSIENSNT